jgi:geranylgeranyl reductase family protein
MRTCFDVIVVGGGPAGSTAARRAAQQGASVLLLDAATFPRSKPCGGAVSAQAMSYLDFAFDESLSQADVFGARVHFEERTVEARAPFRIAVLTRRSELDAYLLGKAVESGVRVLENARVIRAESQTDHVAVHTSTDTFQGRFVIGADGAQSVVAGLVRPRWPRSQYAVTYEFDVPCRPTVTSSAGRDLIDIYFGTAYMGYGWVFAKRDHLNVGLGALASRAPNVKTAALDFHRALPGSGIEVGTERRNAVGWMVPAGGHRRVVAGGRVMLAGDAAGFVDPFYGEGIAYAILSGAEAGRLAGRAARGLEAVERTQASYSSFCRRSIDRNLRYGLLFARLLHAWPGGLLRLFSTNHELLERYLDVPAARLTYRQYFKWFLPRAVAGLPKAWLSRNPFRLDHQTP